VKISKYLDVQLVALLDSSTREGAIDVLIDLCDQAGKLPNKAAFKKAITEREELISTGIGMGVAVPHAKLKGFTEFSIAIGIQQKKGLEWNAIDHAPVRLIFLVSGPDDRQSEYLQILSLLTIAIKDQNLRKELMRAASTEEVIHAFSAF
jgi:PTS system nitrogen regulatory IIA component